MPPVIRFKKYLFIFFAFCAGILHCSCSHDRLSYLYTGLHEHKNEQKDLVALFEKEDEPQIRFALIDKIAAHLQAEHKIKSLAVFLQSVIDAEPDNPYNGYFLLRLAAAYRDVQEDAIAAYYFEYIVQNYSDMIVNGQSIHLLCLKNLIELSGTGTKSVVYYSRLLTDFYNEFDPAQAYFMLAQAYEKQGEWQGAIPAERWRKLPDWAVCDLSEYLETLQAWLQCPSWDDQARLLRSAWPAPTENDVALVRAAAERYVDVPGMSILAGFVEAIAEQGLDPVLSEMQAMCEAGALVSSWRPAHAERKGRQYLKKHQNMAGNPRCHYALQRIGLPDEERESLLALLNLVTVSSVDLAYDVAEDLDDADDAVRDFINAANIPGMYCALRVRPDLAEATPHGRFAVALCAYLTGHPDEGKRYLDLIGTTANPDDRESFRRCVHTLGRDPDYADALAPVAEWLRTG